MASSQHCLAFSQGSIVAQQVHERIPAEGTAQQAAMPDRAAPSSRQAPAHEGVEPKAATEGATLLEPSAMEDHEVCSAHAKRQGLSLDRRVIL